MPERSRKLLLRVLAACAAGCVAGCAGPHSALDPASREAALIADLSWFMFALAAGVMALVGGLLLVALWRGRRPHEESRLNGMALVIGGGIVLPLIVLPILWIVSLQAMAALAEPDEPYALEIDIHGRQFSYEVRYPDLRVTLIDEVRIPVGQPVLLRLHADDVIHSFWVPRLGGKTDLIPGVVNETWIRATEPGVYEGRCAEFCGVGHFEMGLVVIAEEADDFAQWLAQATP
jgi:cytochrome c oxidase subunit II